MRDRFLKPDLDDLIDVNGVVVRGALSGLGRELRRRTPVGLTAGPRRLSVAAGRARRVPTALALGVLTLLRVSTSLAVLAYPFSLDATL